MSNPAVRRDRWITSIGRFSENQQFEDASDAIAVEEPLEIRVRVNGVEETVSVTMRTPGDDPALAAGFLFSEGLLDPASRFSVEAADDKENSVVVAFGDGGDAPDLERLKRNFYAASSCGICGKSSLDAVVVNGARPVISDASVSPDVIRRLPSKLRERQDLFDSTGGLHAAAFFDASGQLIDIREDVGRHNAVDKLVGARILDGTIGNVPTILFLSGRASFELLQKAVMARVPVVCAVGAPSSLAVAAAREFGVTLCGFVRDGRFNVYTGRERIGK